MKKKARNAILAAAVGVAALLIWNRERPPAMVSKIPLVYSDDYNIRLMGIQKLHPFDTEKFQEVFDHLSACCGLGPGSYHEPVAVTDADLLRAHTPEYLASLERSGTIAEIAEMPLLRFIPAWLLKKKLLAPMRLATGGTILAAELALRHGWAINLSGGYHHAKAGSGSGFCYYADIPLAIRMLRARNKNLRALIIDLDAHQGNGLESFAGDNDGIFILDVYNGRIFPMDYAVMKNINMDIPLDPGTGDGRYLEIVEKAVPESIRRARPDIIFYNAGTDILSGDPLGGMNISEAGIIMRDELVFRGARETKTPIVMVLSGGYTKRSGAVVGKSIENILRLVRRG